MRTKGIEDDVQLLRETSNYFPRPGSTFEGPLKSYTYETCCVFAESEDIDDMVGRAKQSSYETMRNRCTGLLGWARSIGYDPKAPGLTLKGDSHVGYYRSKYQGRRCYYVVWSGVEHIWTRPEERPVGRELTPRVPDGHEDNLRVTIKVEV